MKSFFEKNKEVLDDYLKISLKPGSRPDYVQGGGGNTSAKFDDKLMAIKASGFQLSQIKADDCYAVLDYSSIANFYKNTNMDDLKDIEASGSAVTKASVQDIPGLKVLRPSVEAGFHSLLSKYVLHTHPVYANMAACALEGREIIKKALAKTDYSYGFVPYINPGAKLTFEILKEQTRVLEKTGKKPSAIFMQNHGFIATSDDADTCLLIHDEVNKLIASAFNITEDDFPEISLKKKTLNSGKDIFISGTKWVKEIAKNTKYDNKYFCEESLYPDQMVFLNDNISICEEELKIDGEDPTKNKCTIYRGSGDVVYDCSYEEALTIEQTLVATTFITINIEKSGYTVVTMSDSGKDFIANWESEKYRKNLLSGEK